MQKRVSGTMAMVFGLVALACTVAGASVHYVDISGVANRSLEDDGIADNAQGGWSDEGANDMFIYPAVQYGEVERNGHKFKIIDPKTNDGRSVIMLKGSTLDKLAEQVVVDVPNVKGRFVYFVQNSVRSVDGLPPEHLAAVYTIGYADGSKVEIPIRQGAEIRNWWAKDWFDNSGASSWPVFMGRNHYSMRWNYFIGVWAMTWRNPSPEKAITSIALRSEGISSPAIFAITIADENFHESPNLKADYNRPADVPTGYFQPKLVEEQRLLFAEMVKAGMAVGVRRVDVIAPDVLAVTIDATVSRGAGLDQERAKEFQQADRFAVSSDSDASYGGGKRPVRVGRHSYEYWNGDIGPFPQNVIYWHTYYLFLPSPLKSGNEYRIKIEGDWDGPKNEETLGFDIRETTTPVIKINQVAYSPLSRKRYAYLGWWAGDAGRIDYSRHKTFTVIDESTGQEVLRGPIELRKADDNLSGEDVYQMDIAPLNVGAYHIVVPELGRSDTFHVGGQGVWDLYYHTGRAFYHQRCGHELAQPYTEFEKAACHLHVYEGAHLVTSTKYAPRPDEPIREFRGGYHDAADFDVFTYHLRAAAQALHAYQYAPNAFKDGDLNIPESGSGIPDVLDEADWALFSYRDLQLPDGSVPLGRGNDEDYIRDFEREHGRRPTFGVFPPETSSGLEYAAVAALYARLIRPYDAARADAYVESARKALAWSVANPNVHNRAELYGRLFTMWAAAELYSTTGDEAIHNIFKKAYADGGLKNFSWRVGQFVPICTWAYINCKQPGVDKAIQDEMKKDAIQRADHFVRQTELPAYRVGRGTADGGHGWGNLNGGGYYGYPLLLAYWLTGEQKYLDAACLNVDFQLGANPTGKTFMTGMGHRPPNHPQISAFLYTGPNKTGRTVKGIAIYGLAVFEPKWHPEKTPPWRRWRDLGNGTAEISSEFTITETIGAAAMLYSTLYALEQPGQ